MRKSRVVITGLGVIAPNGIGKDNFWQANIEGKSGANQITSFDTSCFESKIACQIKEFDPLEFMPRDLAKRTDRFVHLGLAAAKMAIEDSGLILGKENKVKIGVIIGSGLGGVIFHEEQISTAYQQEFKRFYPLGIPRVSPNSVSSHIAIQYGFLATNMVISAACASGTLAIGEAFRKINNNELELCITGGTEAPITQFTFGAYSALKVLSKRNNIPEEASRPFDKDRDGFVLSEGSAILVIEELSHALERQAHIYAEIIGYSASSGAYHIVMPEPNGKDAAKVMTDAIKDAGVKPEEINYINAHGTSTQANDIAETKAIKDVFGESAYKIPISSTKSMIGHSIGAAGAIEALVSILAIENNIIPPTINYKNKDPNCDLDYTPNKARHTNIDTVLSNSFGFGSCNASIILRRYKYYAR